MGAGIIVCGCNGSGKSTLGRALAKKLHYQFIDIEDIFFPKSVVDYPYDYARPRDEVEQILLDEAKKHDHFVLAAVKGDYGVELPALYKYAVHIEVPKEVRLERIWNRSFQKFGNRMLPGGDLYEREKLFYEMAASRSEQDIREWVESLECHAVCIDGMMDVLENVNYIVDWMGKVE